MQFARRLTLVLAALLVAWTSSPAAGHSDDGALRIVSETPSGSLAVTYEVELIFANDGDPANGATVTATAVGADGVALAPQRLEPTGAPGRYTATVTFPSPGVWQVSITAADPVATLDATTLVGPPPTVAATASAPTTPPPTRVPAAASSTDPAPLVTTPLDTGPADTAPLVTGTSAAPRPSTPPRAVGDDADGNTPVVLAALAGVLAIGAGGAALVRRRRRPQSPR